MTAFFFLVGPQNSGVMHGEGTKILDLRCCEFEWETNSWERRVRERTRVLLVIGWCIGRVLTLCGGRLAGKGN